MYADRQLQPWLDALRDEVPDADILDAHVHVGIADPAGLEATADEAREALERADARALVFPLKEPEGYPAANDRMIALAEEHPDRFVPLCRVDPHADAAGEAQRCVDRGARGIKLHPRGEDFALDDPRLDAVFALADERRLPVMVHAGVGTPEVGAHACDRAHAHPGARIILAHCAIGAFEDVVPEAHDTPNLFFDTSWWNVSDIWAVFRLVPPGQVLHGSDIPFNSPTQAAVMTGRLALQAGLSPDAVRGVLGGTLGAILDGDDLPDLGTVPDEVPVLAPELERLYVTLCSAVVPMLGGDPPGQGLELAKAAVRAPSDRHAAVMDNVSALLEIADGITEPDPLRPLRTPAFDVLLTAALVARTPSVPLPQLASVG
jgi:predicted TIM-barrel fold metal-dependent hydrolase